jgi:cytochrome b
MNHERILVWDLPTRLFHWLLAGTFAGAWLTAESERWIDVHVTLGTTFAGLIAFRLLWGFVGTRHARFSSFVRGPRGVASYLKSLFTFKPEHHVGHNPAGGWAVLALLGLGIVTAVAGFLAYQDYGGHWLEELHEGAASAMLGLVLFHIAAVAVSSLLHKENLVRAMITGLKRGRSLPKARAHSPRRG